MMLNIPIPSVLGDLIEDGTLVVEDKDEILKKTVDRQALLKQQV